jgi:hypothetical protein
MITAVPSPRQIWMMSTAVAQWRPGVDRNYYGVDTSEELDLEEWRDLVTKGLAALLFAMDATVAFKVTETGLAALAVHDLAVRKRLWPGVYEPIEGLCAFIAFVNGQAGG